MKIDGACHCGLITYEADIDPEQVVDEQSPAIASHC